MSSRTNTRRWGVYRLYDRQGRLLYIGKGHDGADDRLEDHRANKPWGHLIARRKWYPLPDHMNTERHAYRIEKRMITTERPLFNRAGNRHRGYEALRRLRAVAHPERGIPQDVNRHPGGSHRTHPDVGPARWNTIQAIAVTAMVSVVAVATVVALLVVT